MRHGLRIIPDTGVARLGGGGLSVLGGGVSYLLRDTFTTTRLSGAVNGSAAEPGPGTRIVTDSGSQVTIADGYEKFVGTAPNTGDPKSVNSASYARVAGLVGVIKWRHLANKALPYSGWVATTEANSHYMHNDPTAGTATDPAYIEIDVVNTTIKSLSGRWLEMMIVLRANGARYYLNQGSGFDLLLVRNAGNATPLSFGSKAHYNQVMSADIDYQYVLQNPWIHSAIASDSFNRADGATGSTDGAGSEEGGGAGLVWSDVLGSSAVSSNRLAFTGLTGGKALSLVDPGTSDAYIQANLYRSAGVVGVVAKYVDANNYLIAYHDGTNIKLDRVTGGSTANVTSAAVAYVDGAPLAIALTEMTAQIVYNDKTYSPYIPVKFQQITSFPLGGTKVGVYTTNLSNTADNFVVWQTRPSCPAPEMRLREVFAFGDSLTDNMTAISGTLRQQLGDAWTTVDLGVGGQTTVEMTSRFNLNVIQKRPQYVTILAGTNDALSGYTFAACTARLQAMYTAAKAAGITVIAITLLPCKNAGSWTAPKQIIIDQINDWILNTAVDVDYRIDAYTPLEDPAAPDALLAEYDSGDHLHPSFAGYTAAAAAIYAGVVWS